MNPTFLTAERSSCGGRTHNEDFSLTASRGSVSCWVVADGLGGHAGGAAASAIACEAAVGSFLSDPSVSAESVRTHILAAHAAVQRRQYEEPVLRQMRTTIVVLVADATGAAWGHVGDSRLYRLRGGRVVAQTKDHSVPQSLADLGEIQVSEIRHHADRSRLLRAIGEDAELYVEVGSEAMRLAEGDGFLLCTDGFWENVYDVEMELDFARTQRPEVWLDAMEGRLQERVERSYDNYTAVAVMAAGEVSERCRGWGLGTVGQVTQLLVFWIFPVLLLLGFVFLARMSGLF